MTDRMTYIHLVNRPGGFPSAGDFAFLDAPLPRVQPGTALVENLYVSVDPYMRQLMDDGWDLHAPLEGRSLGRVVASAEDRLAVGDVVRHRNAWRTHALVRPEDVQPVLESPGVPLSAHLGLLGNGTGLTAYVGLTRIADLRPGETVYISAAAGGVGTAAGQIARLLGAGRVIGSAGSPAKVRHLVDDLGFDAAFDYHDGPVGDRLAKAAPEGIDVYLDNVGGDHLEGAIANLREFGRIAWCGAISGYNGEPSQLRNFDEVMGKSLRVQGFMVRHHLDAREEMESRLVPLLQRGEIVSDETIVDGFENTVSAFLGMLRGENTGKMLVRLR
ncbi:NADP-dependent oxidoreductase [Glycomyces dulcitolivorans]|uniref:NADP-dependent oxidoreductase n=1 Tax=Glycomyces dulcitolivorans TaxID=2200759 RepID=UPI000DD4AA5A|nr:NADP-dependent oxidoreductase [Glycomyces dulcitolivorans]